MYGVCQQMPFRLAYALDVLGFVASIFIAILVGVLLICNPRVTTCLSFQMALALINIARYTQSLFSVKNEDTCAFFGFIAFFTTHLIVFLTTGMAVHLYHTFILEKKAGNLGHAMKWAVPVLAAFILDAVPATNGAYGKSAEVCFLAKSFKNKRLLIYVQYGIIQLGALIFCTFTFLVIFGKTFVPPPTEYMSDTMRNLARIKHEAIRAKHKARACAVYPLICIICHLGQTLNAHISFYEHDINYFIQLWTIYGPTLAGILNLLALFLQPTFRQEFTLLLARKRPVLEFSLPYHPSNSTSNSKRLPSQDITISHPIQYSLKSYPANSYL